MLVVSLRVSRPIESPLLLWEARQVLRDRHGEPHMFIRLRLKGGHFPRRGVAPFARIGKVTSAFVEIARNEESAYAYFDRPLDDGALIEFGYGRDVILRCLRPFCAGGVQRAQSALRTEAHAESQSIRRLGRRLMGFG